MPSNTISARVFDFLKEYPPFSLLEEAQLAQLAERVEVRYLKPGALVFEQGEEPEPFLYMVKEGAIGLFRREASEEVILDLCAEGDVFGLRPLLLPGPHRLLARAREESLIYAVPAGGWKSLLEDHPQLAFFVATSVASEWPAGEGTRPVVHSMPKLPSELQVVQAARPPVTCAATDSIQLAAEVMVNENVGSVIVTNAVGAPRGIVTDKDFRRLIARGGWDDKQTVQSVMSAPVITLPSKPTAAEVLTTMVAHNIRHICLTEDGTDQSPVLGLVSEHDILVLQGNDPSVLQRELVRARSGSDLARIREQADLMLGQYLDRGVSLSFLSSVMASLNDALLRRALEIVRAEVGSNPFGLRWCWLSLGSQGRKEQLLRTDQDSALLFEKPHTSEVLEEVRDWFVAMAEQVAGLLAEAGYPYCPAEMMAHNPKWCLTLDEWEAQFGHWIRQPTPEAVLKSNIFFDFRPVFGDTTLVQQLRDRVLSQLRGQELFLAHMARQAQDKPPPLTFFRKFVLERSGTHQDTFDIKARAIMPLADAARVLILHNGRLEITNTVARFHTLADLEPQNRELYEQAAEAFQILQRFRTEEGINHRNDGRHIDPAALSKMQRLQLRNCFPPIRGLQRLLGTRFQTAHFA